MVSLLPSIIIKDKEGHHLQAAAELHFLSKFTFSALWSNVHHLAQGFSSSQPSFHCLCFSENNTNNMHYLLESMFVLWKYCTCRRVRACTVSVCVRMMWICDSDSNEGKVCSAGTGVRLCDFITLHANFNWEREWRNICRKWIEWEREREEEKDGVMTELRALCLYMHLQAN